MAAETVGQLTLRAENYERMVKGFALQLFKMKQLCMESTSSAWAETYFREGASELTGGTGSAIKGIPRLAQFPYGEPNWTKITSYIEKYGMEGVVSWEDAMLDNIDVIAREMLRISRAVANAVDSTIFAALKANAGNTVTVAATYEWDSATIANRDPIQDILNAKRELYLDNFDPDGGNTYIALHPTDYSNLLGNTKVVNNPAFKAADVVANGIVGQICGCKILVSNVVDISGALVCIAKECATWKSAKGAEVYTIEDKGIKDTIRAFEAGVCQVTTPNAICKIVNTKI